MISEKIILEATARGLTISPNTSFSETHPSAPYQILTPNGPFALYEGWQGLENAWLLGEIHEDDTVSVTVPEAHYDILPSESNLYWQTLAGPPQAGNLPIGAWAWFFIMIVLSFCVYALLCKVGDTFFHHCKPDLINLDECHRISQAANCERFDIDICTDTITPLGGAENDLMNMLKWVLIGGLAIVGIYLLAPIIFKKKDPMEKMMEIEEARLMRGR